MEKKPSNDRTEEVEFEIDVERWKNDCMAINNLFPDIICSLHSSSNLEIGAVNKIPIPLSDKLKYFFTHALWCSYHAGSGVPGISIMKPAHLGDFEKGVMVDLMHQGVNPDSHNYAVISVIAAAQSESTAEACLEFNVIPFEPNDFGSANFHNHIIDTAKETIDLMVRTNDTKDIYIRPDVYYHLKNILQRNFIPESVEEENGTDQKAD